MISLGIEQVKGEKMYYLKLNSFLIVGNEIYKKHFYDYFDEITVVSCNEEAFNHYVEKKPAIVFLDYSENNAIKVLKDIRKNDRKTIVVFIMSMIKSEMFLDILPLQLFSYLRKPFDNNEIKKLLTGIELELEYREGNIKRIKGMYSFNLNKVILYNERMKEVKLTKNEKKFLEIMFNTKDSFVSIEKIEYTIWEEDSLCKDCNGRLKSLLNGIRKKLPKESIINEYGLGYKLER